MWQVHCKPQRIYASNRSWRDTGDTLGTCYSRIIVDFFILKSKEHADVIKGIANKWREQHNFDIHDTLVFDGELIGSFRN